MISWGIVSHESRPNMSEAAEQRLVAEPRRVLGFPATAWAAMFLGGGAAGICYLATGATLGLFFGGVLFAALLVPPLSLSEQKLRDRLAVAAGLCDGIAVVWLVAVMASGQISLAQWLRCYVVLIAWCAALATVANLVASCGSGSGHSTVVAAAITVTLALLWLTEPIWLGAVLSHFEDQSWLARSAIVHPLFALNGVLKNLGIWTEQPVAYRYLFTLGQDVPYKLPPSIVPAAAVHLLAAAAALLGWLWGEKRRT